MIKETKVKEKVKKIKRAFSHGSSQEQSKKLKALKWRWSSCQKPSATRCVAWWKARIYYYYHRAEQETKSAEMTMIFVSKVKEKVKKIKKAFSHDSSQEQSKKLKALKWRWSLCQKPSATRCDAWWKARIYYFKKKKLLDNNER